MKNGKMVINNNNGFGFADSNGRQGRHRNIQTKRNI